MKDSRRLHSGRVSVKTPSQVASDRYQFLDLASAEPNLGTADDNSILTTDTSGQRIWTSNLNVINANVSSNLAAERIYSDNIFFANGQPYISDTRSSNIYNGTATATANITLIDTLSVSNLRSVKWLVSAKDITNSTYKSSTVDAITDQSTVYYNEYSVVLSSNVEVVSFTVSIVSGNLNLYAVGDSNNVTITYQRTTLDTNTVSGYVPGAGYIQSNLGSGTATQCVNDVFTGTGSQTNFSLSVSPTNENQTLVSVGGVLQPKSAYSVSGSTLTLSSAPANGIIVDVTSFVTTTVTGYTGSRGYTGSAATSVVGYSGSAGGSALAGNTYINGTLTVNNNIVPTVTDLIDLGTPTQRFGSLYLSGNTIILGDSQISVAPSGDISFTTANGSVILTPDVINFIANITPESSTTGYTGSAGTNGTNGYTGSAGAGYTGSRGLAGYTGSKGADGTIGVDGYTGSAGAVGYTGSKGADGIIGVDGYTGSIGFTGSAGVNGAVGYTGSASTVAGFTGSQGVIGFTGSAGGGGGGASNIPPNNQTSSYTLVIGDVGKYINITTGGVTVPSGVFASGDIISIYNNSTSAQTITQGASVTMYLVGTSGTGNRTLAQRGFATVMCVGTNEFVISGGGLT